MELRDIEIFLTLAEELHFGRTAERLHVSQARVSQAIRAQERRIGAPLFERTSRRVSLTPIGRRLRTDLQQVDELLRQALARAEAAAAGRTLRVGVFGHAGHELGPLVAAFAARHPGAGVEFREINGSDPFTALRSGEHEVNVLWLPVREPDLTVGPTVLVGRRVLAVPAEHPLAERGWASLEDLADHRVADLGPAAPEYWVDAMVPTHTPRGRRIPRGPVARTFHELLSAVAGGECVHPFGEIAARYNSPPGIVFVPMPDSPELRWALVWRSTADDTTIRALARTATDLGPIHL
ncbi:LysR family transcriptional regulator [Nocardia thailandica]|uniref:LysR family transcriptional regulator n=1 Tax=Nocardia thailandica TaxID=257275 RepID=A0ABW6PQ04_9NOCA